MFLQSGSRTGIRRIMLQNKIKQNQHGLVQDPGIRINTGLFFTPSNPCRQRCVHMLSRRGDIKMENFGCRFAPFIVRFCGGSGFCFRCWFYAVCCVSGLFISADRLRKTNQTRTDYSDNIQHYLPPRRESICTHDRPSLGEGLRELLSASTHAFKIFTFALTIGK